MKSFICNENNSFTKGGRMKCSICGSLSGFKQWKYRLGNDSKKWWNKMTCISCGSYEKRFCMNNMDIIEQKLSEIKKAGWEKAQKEYFLKETGGQK